MTTKYKKKKKNIEYVGMCSIVQDHRIKFKVLNQDLGLKEQDFEMFLTGQNTNPMLTCGLTYITLRLCA